MAAQTDIERKRAAGDALLEVLSRLTGLASIPRTPEVSRALAQADAFYSRYVFFNRRDALGVQETYVRIIFQEAALQELLRTAQLPVWWSQRPRVMVWLVLDESGRREILDASSQHPLVSALQERARQRGIKLDLPLMDLDDTLAVSSADVWGKVGQSVDAAAERYGADLVLVGRVSLNVPLAFDEQTFRGDWEVWLEGQPVAETFRSAGALTAAEAGIDMVADRLAERYAVLPREGRVQRVEIGGVQDPTDYASLMRYLIGLEFLDNVDVTAIDDSTLHVDVTTRAQIDQLVMLLTANGLFREDKLTRNLGLRLLWQG